MYKVEKLKVKIRSLSSPDIEYKVKRVFLTFEEEEGKRDALRLLGSPVTKKVFSNFLNVLVSIRNITGQYLISLGLTSIPTISWDCPSSGRTK